MMGHMGTSRRGAPALYPNIEHEDPSTDFAPVGMAAGTPILIVGQEGLCPPRTLAEFVAYLPRRSGDKVDPGPCRASGSVSHIHLRAAERPAWRRSRPPVALPAAPAARP